MTEPKRPLETATLGGGCFWCLDAVYRGLNGIVKVESGYAGGTLDSPTYEVVCSGRTGHAEVVLVAFDSNTTSFQEMLRLFWEGHDPTQGMRQGNDVGTQYRSLILWENDAQHLAAQASLTAYQDVLNANGHGLITTEIKPGDATNPFYYAEDYHQQYLAKNPGGYCGLGGTGVSCPVGLTTT
jgi:peptide-methionine (S)-S-oxide reductase